MPSGPFWYIRNTQYPYPNPSSGADSIWGETVPSSQNTTHLLGPYCHAGFKVSSITGGAALQASLKLDDTTIANTDCTLVMEGLIDPTTALGPGSWLPGHVRNHSRIIYIGQSAYGEVALPLATTDSTAVTDRRTFILNSMKEWVGITQ